jgi:hypothetical protein
MNGPYDARKRTEPLCELVGYDEAGMGLYRDTPNGEAIRDKYDHMIAIYAAENIANKTEQYKKDMLTAKSERDIRRIQMRVRWLIPQRLIDEQTDFFCGFDSSKPSYYDWLWYAGELWALMALIPKDLLLLRGDTK